MNHNRSSHQSRLYAERSPWAIPAAVIERNPASSWSKASASCALDKRAADNCGAAISHHPTYSRSNTSSAKRIGTARTPRPARDPTSRRVRCWSSGLATASCRRSTSARWHDGHETCGTGGPPGTGRRDGRRRLLHAHRLELALLGDVSWQVPLAGDEARAAIITDAFDEIDLGLLSTLDDAVVDVGVGLGDEPGRVAGRSIGRLIRKGSDTKSDMCAPRARQ